MSKLIRIRHVRCDEEIWGKYTYLLAPDDLTEEQLSKDIDKAVELHIKALRDFNALEKKKDKKDKFSILNLSSVFNYPDEMTVAEIKKKKLELEEEQKVYDLYKTKAGRSFGYFMKELGYILLNDAEDITEGTAYWGHNHDLHIDESSTKIDIDKTDLYTELLKTID